MRTIIYESNADHRATAERHFRTAEQKMLQYFEGIEKGYTVEVNGWTLEIRCYDENFKINLMETCNWSVEYDNAIKIASIQVDINREKHELIFSLPVFSNEKKVEFIGYRTP